MGIVQRVQFDKCWNLEATKRLVVLKKSRTRTEWLVKWLNVSNKSMEECQCVSTCTLREMFNVKRLLRL